MKWHLNTGYATRTWRENGKTKAVTMQALLMNTPKGMETDHINQDKLDNRRSNLRIVTSAQNKWNMGLQPTNTTGYKGVTYNKHARKYYARIRVNGRRIALGYFGDVHDAGKAYQDAEKIYHGDFLPLTGSVA